MPLRICLLTLLLSIAAPLCAEHRVALLIGNSKYDDEALAAPAADLKALAGALEKFGFRCTLLENLPGEKLKSALESFAAGTPTRGTAFVHFSGQVLEGNHKGRDGLFLVAADATSGDARSIGNTGFAIESLLESLHTRGGSSVNVVVAEPAGDIEALVLELPADTLLALADTQTLVGKLSNADEFLAAVRSASRWVDDSLTNTAHIAGKGSTVVSPPDKFDAGRRAGDEWVNARGMVFCWCPPGKYVAGSPEDEPGRYPDETQREVEISEGFWISKYELTLRENLRNRPHSTIAVHKNDPLTMINLDDARRMTSHTLSEAERQAGRLPSDWEYTLPTEDQWEYAARAGTATRFSFGDDLAELPRHANFGDASYYNTNDVFSNAAHRALSDGAAGLARVGSYEPNPWGLYDMHGNVAEWCIDSAIRGGSWVSRPENCRSAHRDWFTSRNEQNFIGYRLIIQKKQAEAK